MGEEAEKIFPATRKAHQGFGWAFPLKKFSISVRRDARHGPNRAQCASDDQHRSSSRDIPSSNVHARHSDRGGGFPPRGCARRGAGQRHLIVIRPFRFDAGTWHDRRPHEFVEPSSETKRPPKPLLTSLSRKSKTICVVPSKYASCNREVGQS